MLARMFVCCLVICVSLAGSLMVRLPAIAGEIQGCQGKQCPPYCAAGACSGTEACRTNPNDTSNCACRN